jgi:hypothetical protein
MAAMGQDSVAVALADSLLAAPGAKAVHWDSLTAALARTNPRAATELVDRIAASDSVPAQVKGDLLLADARRWALVDSARALERLAQSVAAQGEAGGPAHLTLVTRALAAAPDFEALRPLADSLLLIERAGGPAAQPAAIRRLALTRILRIADSIRPDTASSPEGDLWLFHLAEALRDSVGASRAAVTLLALVPEHYPGSPFAPKAILARAALEPLAAESLAYAAGERYPGSPYLLALRGEEPGAEYVALEDSLRRWAAVQRVRAGRQQRRAAQQPVDTAR